MHWLDIVLVVLLILSVVRGYRSGFVSQAIELGSLILAWFLANPVSLFISDLFASKGVSLTIHWVAWLISFLAVLATTRILAGFLLKGIGEILGAINHLAGAALSLLVTTMILVLVLNLYTTLSVRYNWGSISAESTIAPKIQEIGETILPTRLLIEREVDERLDPAKIVE